MEPIDLEGLDNDQLRAKLEELARANDYLLKETDVFSTYLKRHAKLDEIEEALEEDGRRGKKGKTKQKAKGPQALTHEQKIEVAVAELESSKVETSEVIAKGVGTVETLQALLQQADLKFAEIKREAFEFKRDVVLAGENTLTGKIMSERVVKYYEDALRSKEGLVDKLRLKNAVLKTQQVKLTESLKGKEEAGDVLHYIDFHQLQIENAQYLGRIEEKNGELLRLKLTTGNSVATLNQLKGRLSELTKESARLRRDIKARSTLLQKLRVDNDDIHQVVAKQNEVVLKLTAAAKGAVDMPQTIDYVELSRTQAAIQHEIASWERKVEIATLTAGQARSKALLTGAGTGMAGSLASIASAAASSVMLGGPGGGAAGGGGGAAGHPTPGRHGGPTHESRAGEVSMLGQTLSDSFFNGGGGGGHGGGIQTPGLLMGLATPAAHLGRTGHSGAPSSAAIGAGRTPFSAGATVHGAAVRTPGLLSVPSSSPSPAPLASFDATHGSSSSSSSAAASPFRHTSSGGHHATAAAPSSSTSSTLAAGIGPSLPNADLTPSYGSTTHVRGVSDTRPLGSITGLPVKQAKKLLQQQPQRPTSAGFRALPPSKAPKGVGGFNGAVQQKLTGQRAGQLMLGRPPVAPAY